ncbi:PH domain-containing protein [Mycetocola sp. 2940]|uniref:PH domain-containing protein n=1 Tax=Mycetocola sp. 2940 TaxID=3156452 RepID=UPI0033996F10
MTLPEHPAVPDLPGSAPDVPPVVEAPRRVEVGGEWRRVSPKYILVDLIGAGITAVIVIAVAILWAVLFQQAWQWWVMAALLVAIAIGAAFTPRRIRAIGYQLRQDDLLFRRGIMWTRVVAVPYGRMQLIDINRGPVARAFGLAELKFVTASAASAIVLPGLPEEEAEQLRDHLVVVAESRRTGL